MEKNSVMLTLLINLFNQDMLEFLLWHSVLRIQFCHSCGTGYSCSSDLIPGPGTSNVKGADEKKKKLEILKQLLGKQTQENINCKQSICYLNINNTTDNLKEKKTKSIKTTFVKTKSPLADPSKLLDL